MQNVQDTEIQQGVINLVDAITRLVKVEWEVLFQEKCVTLQHLWQRGIK